MIEAFDKYVQSYDMNNDKINLKYEHSFRVMHLSYEYALKLGFNKEDVFLAKTIGLLHDIGRFEQLRVYDTFDDSKSIDHADYSVDELFIKNKIVNFPIDRKYYDVIRLSILNHNKYKITGIHDKNAVMHAKLIRDTDKLDILYNIAYLGEIKIRETDDVISSKVLDDIKNEVSVLRNHVSSVNDRICSWMAFAFDINNVECLDKVKEYIEVIYSKLEHKEIFRNVYLDIMKYIEKRMG